MDNQLLASPPYIINIKLKALHNTLFTGQKKRLDVNFNY